MVGVRLQFRRDRSVRDEGGWDRTGKVRTPSFRLRGGRGSVFVRTCVGVVCVREGTRVTVCVHTRRLCVGQGSFGSGVVTPFPRRGIPVSSPSTCVSVRDRFRVR